MKHNTFTFLAFFMSVSFLFSCVSSSERVDPSGDVSSDSAFTQTPAPLRFVSASGFVIVKAGSSTSERMAADMATNLALPYSWWSDFARVGDKVSMSANFTIRKSSVVAEQDYAAAEGVAFFIRKTEMEVSEVEGLPAEQTLHSQSIALSQISDPSGILMKSRMEAIKAQGIQKGFIKLQEARVEEENLILVWDIRG